MEPNQSHQAIIRGDTLSLLRKQIHLSQAGLADRTRGRDQVSVATIKRIEKAGAEGHRANGRIARALAAALGATPDILGKAPEDLVRSDLRGPSGHARYRADLDDDSAMSLQMVEAIYGISVQSQFAMAPLFAALLGECSLKWRSEKLQAVRESLRRISDADLNQAGVHIGVDRIETAISYEAESIEKRDLFGKITADHSWNEYALEDNERLNPFSEYIRFLVGGIGDTPIGVESGDEFTYVADGMPPFGIGRVAFDRLSGGNPLAAFALRAGHVKIAAIPKELLAPTAVSERVEWLASHVPPEERARQAQLDEELARLFEPEVGADGAGGDNAL